MKKITDYVEQDKARAGDERLLAEIDWTRNQRELTEEDEDFHPAGTDEPHWTESSFWAFTHRETSTGGWIYLRSRRNLGLVQCGIYFFDPDHDEAWNALYNAEFCHVALPEDQSYLDLRLENGLSISCLEPWKHHRITYKNADCSIDVELRGVFPAAAAGLGPRTGHIDQPMWATGTLRFGDRTIELDDPAFRDRTWSDRSDYAKMGPNYYIWGTSSDQRQALHATAGVLFNGLVRLEGSEGDVESVARQVVERDPSGRPKVIDAQITCTDGTVTELHGTVLSAFPLMQVMPQTICWISVVSWECNGLVLVGEDHEAWPFLLLRENLRTQGDQWVHHL